jgi:hypothetical protein
MIDQHLFEVSPTAQARFELIADAFPVLLIDNLYARSDEIQAAALRLDFEPPPDPYPGRIAPLPGGNASLDRFLRRMLDMVNRDYLPRLPGDLRVAPLARLHSDFAIVDVHPDDLADCQRIPHVDPVPIFGLVYLNREPRGGTLFFRKVTSTPENAPSPGYLTDSRDGFELAGRIEPAFNRLAIYPGFVPHSGEIAGDWIRSDERFTNPRLTQRLLFG